MPFLKLSPTEIRSLFDEQLASPDLIRLTLGQPLPESSWRKAHARPLLLSDSPVLQLSTQTDKQEFHRNLPFDESAAEIWNLWQQHFSHLHLFTRTRDYQFRRLPDGSIQVQKTKPSLNTAALPTLDHNREKPYLLPEGQPIPFLVEIGIMNRDGKVLAPKYHKFRQINRFAEMVDDVTRDLPRDRPLHVVDFGSGKSYLTFTLHHLLREVQQRDCIIVGLGRNPAVIQTCRSIAHKLQLTDLEFRTEEIADFPWDSGVDVVVSLHACDTATDDVLGAAAGRHAPVILSAPCCQHELAPQLSNSDWSAFLQHGILRERLGSLATDALRAAALEILGYETQLLEFVDLEHTPKNLLIRAVHQPGPVRDLDAKRTRYRSLRAALGIEHFHLEQLLGDQLKSFS